MRGFLCGCGWGCGWRWGRSKGWVKGGGWVGVGDWWATCMFPPALAPGTLQNMGIVTLIYKFCVRVCWCCMHKWYARPQLCNRRLTSRRACQTQRCKEELPAVSEAHLEWRGPASMLWRRQGGWKQKADFESVSDMTILFRDRLQVTELL